MVKISKVHPDVLGEFITKYAWYKYGSRMDTSSDFMRSLTLARKYRQHKKFIPTIQSFMQQAVNERNKKNPGHNFLLVGEYLLGGEQFYKGILSRVDKLLEDAQKHAPLESLVLLEGIDHTMNYHHFKTPFPKLADMKNVHHKEILATLKVISSMAFFTRTFEEAYKIIPHPTTTYLQKKEKEPIQWIPNLVNNAGIDMLAMGEVERAHQVFEGGHDHHKDELSLSGLAYTTLKLGDPNKAFALLRPAFTGEKPSFLVRSLYGQTQAALGRFVGAQRTLTGIVEQGNYEDFSKDPRLGYLKMGLASHIYLDNYYWLAQSLQETGDHDRAITTLERGVKKHPQAKHHFGIVDILGSEYMSNGKKEEGIKLLEGRAKDFLATWNVDDPLSDDHWFKPIPLRYANLPNWFRYL